MHRHGEHVAHLRLRRGIRRPWPFVPLSKPEMYK